MESIQTSNTINSIKRQNSLNNFYNFYNYPSDIKSLIHAINLQGNELVGAEIGVFKAESLCTILHNCPKLKMLYGIDNWQPYADYLQDNYNEYQPAYSIEPKDIELIKSIALNHIKFSGHSNKVVIVEKDSRLAATEFQDNYFDFIFIDTYMTWQQCFNDLEDWYSKVKPGGIFAGHDWNCKPIQQVVNNFRSKYNINNTLSHFDNLFTWRK